MTSPLQYSDEIAMGPSDLELVELTRGGDNAAFGDLWNRHRRAALKAAASLTRNHDPEDMAQEAFLRILTSIRGNGGPREAFRPYLYAVLRSVSMAWQSPHGPIDDIDTVAMDQMPVYSFEAQLIDASITGRAFAELQPEWRTVLWYTEVEGLRAREIAPILGMSPNAVSALSYRAKEGLRASWLQAHLNSERVEEACKWSVERLGKYNRGTLGRKDRDRLQAHLTSCLKCSILVEEIDTLGRQLGIMLLPLFLGPAALDFLAANGGGAATTVGSLNATVPTSTHGVSRAGRLGTTSKATIVLLSAVVAVGGFVAVATVTKPPEPDSAITAPVGIPSKSQLPSPTPQSSVRPSFTALATSTPALPAPVPPVENVLVVSPDLVLLPGTPPATLVPDPQPTGSPEPTPEPSPTPDPPPDPNPHALDSPEILPLDPNGLFLPILQGTGEPGATVTVLVGASRVAQTVVTDTGSWSVVPEVVPGPDGTVRFSAYQVVDGVTSETSEPSAAIPLPTPEIISLRPGDGRFEVTFTGPVGAIVEAIVDGVPTGNFHTLTGSPLVRSLPDLAPGNHTIGLRFVDSQHSQHGATITQEFSVRRKLPDPVGPPGIPF